MSFAGRTYMITGGASGIGLATARALLGEGARVVLVDRNASLLETEAAGLQTEGKDVESVALDVTDSAAVDETVTSVSARSGVQGLVNAAGVAHLGTIADVTPAEWDRVLEINLKGAYNTCRAVIPVLEQGGGGAIVNLASISGRTKSIYSAPNYVASKAGVIGLTMGLAAQHAANGVRVNCVAPGVINTPMMEMYSDEQWEIALKSIPMGRIGEASDVANVIVTLLSDNWSYVTGQTINVNGGQFMQ